MSMNSLIQRLTAKKKEKPTLSIVILSDGIYVSKVSEEFGIEPAVFFELENNNWQFQLGAALDSEDISNLKATVTLGSQFYQSYQLDKPVVPKEGFVA
ncbi:hypothetical protein [Vibrio algicola]|uniref:Uncharacterized protein n=2 Tax=Vibrio TaxID=662 RepID=A0A5Q0THC4_9VIBR|nr:hypothetical protein [Vibrio algicola]